MTEDGWIAVEVVYATAGRQTVLVTWIPAGASVADAVGFSGIAAVYPEIEPATTRFGIYGRRVAADVRPAAGDRIEIYRPLALDPQQSRRQRAQRGRMR